MMLYTFHGPNRTGDRERGALHEAPWIMTAPLLLLGALSAFGGWLNLPALFSWLGPELTLHHWLEPVVGPHELAITHGEAVHLSHGTEYALIGAAVAVAVLGIAAAVWRLKPDRLPPKKSAAAEQGFERVLAHKYYVDEAYDRAIVRPTVTGSRVVLWRVIDAGIIDGLLVNGSGYLMRGFGWVGSRMQTGSAGTYAWVIVIGAIAVIGVLSCR